MSMQAASGPLCRKSQKGRISGRLAEDERVYCKCPLPRVRMPLSGHWTSVQLEIGMWICRDCRVSLPVRRKV